MMATSNKQKRQLWGHVIQDQATLTAVSKRLGDLYRTKGEDRAKVLRELLAAFGINKVLTFQDAQKAISTHIEASANYLTIEKMQLKVGDSVIYNKRPAVISSISYTFTLGIKFTDGQKPKGLGVNPTSVKPRTDLN